MERGLLPCVYKVTYLGSLWYHHRHPVLIQHSLHQLWDWGYTEQIYWAAAPVRALQGKSGWPMAGVSIPLHLQPQGINQASGFSLFFKTLLLYKTLLRRKIYLSPPVGISGVKGCFFGNQEIFGMMEIPFY